MALISRKPYCNWCENRGQAWGPHNNQLYPCSCGEEIAKLHPGKIRWDKNEKMGLVKEKQRCPDKRFFKPIYTLEQVRQYNHHK